MGVKKNQRSDFVFLPQTTKRSFQFFQHVFCYYTYTQSLIQCTIQYCTISMLIKLLIEPCGASFSASSCWLTESLHRITLGICRRTRHSNAMHILGFANPRCHFLACFLNFVTALTRSKMINHTCTLNAWLDSHDPIKKSLVPKQERPVVLFVDWVSGQVYGKFGAVVAARMFPIALCF
jgi:hypothetical protein